MTGCNISQNAEAVFINGAIHSIDNAMTTHTAMAIKKGKIAAIGSNEDILKGYRAGKIIDLEGNHVYPGFIDAHSHFLGYSHDLTNADLTGSGTFGEVVKRLEEHASKVNSLWLQGRGWDQNLWPGQKMPGNTLLNQAFPEVPVYITRVDGHAALANDAALQKADITGETIIEGGEVVAEDGKPTGLLLGRAMNLVSTIIPAPPSKDIIRAMNEAQQNLFSVGLTTVTEAGLDKDEILLLDSVQKSGDLKIRIYAMANPTSENMETFVKQGKYITGRLTLRSIKLFADGALGSHGALLLEPYSDDEHKSGIYMEDPSFLEKISLLAFENNYQVNTHCIGDSAARLMLNIYSTILDEGNDLRWRIEHAQVVDPKDLELFGKYNIIPSVQTIHAVSDMGWVKERLGKRITNAYIYRSLMEQNGWLANGSDFPVEPINPLYGFHSAFARKDKTGNPPGGFYPQEALTREDALKAMTIWAAKANHEDNIKGSLEVGKVADFVVMKENLLTVPEEEIYNLEILQTFLNGEMVYSR